MKNFLNYRAHKVKLLTFAKNRNKSAILNFFQPLLNFQIVTKWIRMITTSHKFMFHDQRHQNTKYPPYLPLPHEPTGSVRVSPCSTEKTHLVPLLVQCWVNIPDVGPAFNQCWTTCRVCSGSSQGPAHAFDLSSLTLAFRRPHLVARLGNTRLYSGAAFHLFSRHHVVSI